MWESGGPGRLSHHEGEVAGPMGWSGRFGEEIPLVPPRESNPGFSIVRFSQIRLEFTNHLTEYTGPLPCSFLIIGVRYPALYPKFGVIVLPCYIVHYVSALSASI